MMLFLFTIFVMLCLQQSVCEVVECYGQFDPSSGRCGNVLGAVDMDDCCLNVDYGYMDTDGNCKSCRKAKWSEWSPWSSCSASCKEGVRMRRRRCYGIGKCRDPEMLGELQTKACEDKSCCPEDGGWTEWGEWQPCSVTCEKGFKKRQRTCTEPPPKCGGSCFGPNEQIADCEEPSVCPTHGGWSEWGNWEPCTGTCKTEGREPPQQRRSRTCTNPAPSSQPRGRHCEGSATEPRACQHLPFCAVPGNWGPWTHSSPCSVTCGVGLETKTRECNSPPPKHGGQPCQGNGIKKDICNTKEPCPVDGEWSSWEPWGACENKATRSIRCRKREGSQKRERWCERDWSGEYCKGDIVAYRSCFDIQDCKMKHYWTEWSEWGLCHPPCGPGSNRTRKRECKPDVSEYKGESKNFYGTPLLDCPDPVETESLPCTGVPSCEDALR
ncbi:properdin [Chanos chanos]|uniref:Properdin n=1 Tax=Chanos chanos TaxID=29144 RepID=A0A6J2W6Z7_CHACN|nr:properdin [Chanos chanos]XP_030639762.1 properdin [Chanos chanos]